METTITREFIDGIAGRHDQGVDRDSPVDWAAIVAAFPGLSQAKKAAWFMRIPAGGLFPDLWGRERELIPCRANLFVHMCALADIITAEQGEDAAVGAVTGACERMREMITAGASISNFGTALFGLLQNRIPEDGAPGIFISDCAGVLSELAIKIVTRYPSGRDSWNPEGVLYHINLFDRRLGMMLSVARDDDAERRVDMFREMCAIYLRVFMRAFEVFPHGRIVEELEDRLSVMVMEICDAWMRGGRPGGMRSLEGLLIRIVAIPARPGMVVLANRAGLIAALCAVRPELFTSPQACADIEEFLDRMETECRSPGVAMSDTVVARFVRVIVNEDPSIAYPGVYRPMLGRYCALFARIPDLRRLYNESEDELESGLDCLFYHVPALALVRNFQVLELIIDLAVAWAENGLAPRRLLVSLITPLFIESPRLTGAEHIDELRTAVAGLRRFSEYGLMPPTEETDRRALSACFMRLAALRAGAPADLCDAGERMLFYSALASCPLEFGFTRYEWRIDSFIDKFGAGRSSRSGEVRVALGANTIRDKSSARDMVISFRDTLLKALCDRSAAIALICGDGRLGARVRRAIGVRYAGTAEDDAALARRLYSISLSRRRPEILGAVGTLVLLYALKTVPGLKGRLAATSVPAVFDALRDLLDACARFTADEVLREEHGTLLLDRIADLTGKRPSDRFAALPLWRKERALRDEMDLYGNILESRTGIQRLRSGRGDKSVIVRATFNPDDEPLMFVEELYRARYRIELKRIGRGAGRNIVYQEHRGGSRAEALTNNFSMKIKTREGLWCACGHDSVDDREITHGMDERTFSDSDLNGRRREEIIALINGIMRLDEITKNRISRLVGLLARHVIPLVSMRSPATKAVRDALGTLPSAVARPDSGRGEIVFIPSGGLDLIFRGVPACDCASSHRYDPLIAHPGVVFYKVIHAGIWSGYAAVIEMENKGGSRALAVDVINVNTPARLDWAKIFIGFREHLVTRAINEGFDRILVPESKNHISNYEHIAAPIRALHRGKPKVRKGEYKLSGPGADFHSLVGGYRISWERT